MATLEQAGGAAVSLDIQCATYGPEHLSFPGGAPSHVSVTLRALGEIEGIVVFPDGTSAGPGIHVLAYNWMHKDDDINRSCSVLSGEDARQHAVTDTSGHFLIADVVAKRRYSLIAGGRGLLTTRPVEGVLAGEGDPQRIVVEFGFAAVIELTEGNGAAVPFSLATGGLRISPPHDPRGNISSVKGTASAILAGFPVDMAVPTENRLIQVSSSESPLSSVEGFKITADLPGFRPLAIEFSASPLTKTPQMTRVTLIPTAEGWGRVEVEFQGLGRALQPSELQFGVPGSLLLWTNSEDGFMSFVKADRDGTYFADRIPWGNYNVQFVASPNGLRFPPGGAAPLHVTVGPEPAKLFIDLRQTGSLTLHFMRADGSEYSDEVLIAVSDGGVTANGSKHKSLQGNVQSIQFRSPPYVIPITVAGRTGVSVYDPSGFKIDGSATHEAEVLRGERADLRFIEQ
jgi:hypothetical protein